MVEIENSSAVVGLFGHWPSFHDAELITLRLDATGYRDPVLEVDFEVAEYTSDVDERGHFRVRQRARVSLRFERVARLRLEGFWRQNVLTALHLAEAGPEDVDDVVGDDPEGRRRYRVHWGSALGCAAEFLCDSVAVVAARPIAPAT